MAVMVACDVADRHRPLLSYDAAMAEAGLAFGAEPTEGLRHSNIERAIQRMVESFGAGCPDDGDGHERRSLSYAGVPWFQHAVQEDGVITALECLWIRPG